MQPTTIYCQLEDDLHKISQVIESTASDDIILVFPKRSYFFGDSLNLRLLKKHTALLGKKVSIMTADERGQIYAKDAGFSIKPISVNAAKNSTEVAKSSNIATNAVLPAKKPQPQKTAAAKPAPKKLMVSVKTPKLQVQDTVFPEVSGITELLDQKKRERSKTKKIISTILTGLIIGIVISAILIIPTATVVVAVKTEAVTKNFEIKLDGEASSDTPENLTIKSTIIDRTLDMASAFNSTGKKEVGSKSRGKVLIINISGQTINLKSATTTLKVGEKTYQLVPEITTVGNLSPKKASEPNSGTEVEIVATNPGGELNLPAGQRLEITNQVFGSKPELLFAKAKTEITGGNSRFISFISEADIENSKKKLIEQMIQHLSNEYKQNDMEVPTKAARVEILEFNTDRPSGSENPSFKATGKIRVRVPSFSSKVILSMLRNRLEQSMNGKGTLQPANKDTLLYQVEGLPDEKGSGKVTVEYQSTRIGGLTTKQIKSMSQARTKQAALEKIRELPEVQNVEIQKNQNWIPIMPLLLRNIIVRMLQ